VISIADCLQRASELQSCSDTARLDVELLLARALDKPRTYLYTWPQHVLSQLQYQRFVDFLERRKRGEPIAYLLGEKEFWSLSLKVGEATLIPRPETELLVETALSLLPNNACRVLDLGTGTGAIALALASERPSWRILAVDKSSAAINVAIANCRRHGFTNVEITRSDWFENVAGGQAFDMIVANPPYIEEGDPHLEQGDVRFEPRAALVAGNKGLADIHNIIASAREYLKPGGWVVIEHGYQQGDQVRRLFADKDYGAVETKQDLSGRDRLTLARTSPARILPVEVSHEG
jgi:release factor glutamine methyltransferase